MVTAQPRAMHGAAAALDVSVGTWAGAETSRSPVAASSDAAPQHHNDLGLVHRLHAHMNAVVALEMSTLRTLTRSAGERLALGDFLVVCRQSFHVTRERFADESLARVFRLLRDGDPDDGGASRATIAVGSLGYFLSIRPSRLGELLKLGLGAFKRHAERQSSVQSDRRRAAAANAGAADPPDVCASSTLSSFSTTASYSGRRAEPVIPFMNDARMAQARRSTGRVLQTSLRLYSPERPSRPGESARLPAGRPPVALATPIRSVPACRRVRAEPGVMCAALCRRRLCARTASSPSSACGTCCQC